MDKRYLRKDGEETEAYIIRLMEIRMEENPNDLEWEDMASFCGYTCHPDSLRKAIQPNNFGAYHLIKWLKKQNFATKDEIMKLEERTRELYAERIKLSDIKNEYKWYQREKVRSDSMFEKIDASAEKIIKNKKIIIPEPVIIKKGNDAMFTAFADPHYGAEFEIKGFSGEILNKYGKPEFRTRMFSYRDEILDFCEMHNCNEVHICDLGDSIEGKLHVSQLQALKSDIVDDIWEYAEFMGDLIQDITNRGLFVHLYTSEGNHSDLRLLTGKKGDFPHENVEKIYFRYMNKFLKNNPNFKLHSNINGKNYFDIKGYKFFSVHGQNEKNLRNSINEYEDTYKININYFMCGHLHSKHEFEPCIGKEVIQVRSVMGFNDYAESIKKTSEAGAIAFVIREGYGKKYINDIKF